MRIVTPIVRIHKQTPGFDCMFAPCQHTTKGEHGVDGGDDLLGVVATLDDDRKVCLSLQLSMDRYPDTLPVGWLTRLGPESITPVAHDLSLHLQIPRTALYGHVCDIWFGEGCRCEIAFTTALGAGVLFAGFELDRDRWSTAEYERQRREPADRYRANGGPDEALWQRLEAKLHEQVAQIAPMTPTLPGPFSYSLA